jgi:hypothetical protein
MFGCSARKAGPQHEAYCAPIWKSAPFAIGEQWPDLGRDVRKACAGACALDSEGQEVGEAPFGGVCC